LLRRRRKIPLKKSKNQKKLFKKKNSQNTYKCPTKATNKKTKKRRTDKKKQTNKIAADCKRVERRKKLKRKHDATNLTQVSEAPQQQ
jgi:hypothetical protein